MVYYNPNPNRYITEQQNDYTCAASSFEYNGAANSFEYNSRNVHIKCSPLALSNCESELIFFDACLCFM